MRPLYCLEDFSHDRFAQEIDGGYHRIVIFNAAKESKLYQQTVETPVETHPFHCDVCGGPAIDLDDPRTLKDRLKTLIKRIQHAQTAATCEERLELLTAFKTRSLPSLGDLLNPLSKALLREEDGPQDKR